MFSSIIDSKKVEPLLTSDASPSDEKKRPKIKTAKPTTFDIVRMVLMGITFCIVCFVITVLSPVKYLNVPLQKYLGIHPRYAPLAWVAYTVSKWILATGGIFWTCTSDKSGYPPKAIYMYNHGSNMDTVVVYGYVGFVRQLYKKSLDKFFLFRWALTTWAYVPVVRENKEQAMTAVNVTLAGMLAEGHSPCLAPEGTRTLTGELQPFKKGGFHLAVNTKTAIVPMILSGSYEVWPPNLLFASVGNIKIRALEPIAPKEGQSATDFMEEVREVFLKAPQEAIEPPTVWNYLAVLTALTIYAYWPVTLLLRLVL